MNENATKDAPMEVQAQACWELDDLGILGLIATDSSLVIRYWNDWMTAHSGLSRDQVIGKPIFEIFPSLLERHLDKLYQTALAGQPTILSQRIHKHLFPLRTSLLLSGKQQVKSHPMYQRAAILPLIRQGTVVGTITVIDDVTERVFREQQLEQKIALQEALVATSRAILTLSLDDCLKRIVREVSALVGANFVALLLKERRELRVVSSLFEGEERCDWPPIEIPEVTEAMDVPTASHVAAWVVRSGQTTRIDDVHACAENQRLLTFHPKGRSVIGAPLRVGDELMGAIVAESTRPAAFTENEEQLFLGLALSGAIAIQNAKLYEQQASSEKQVRTLMETVPSAIVAFDTDRKILELNRAAEQLLGCRREEVWGRDFFELFVPKPQQHSLAVDVRCALEGSEVRGLEVELQTTRGQRIIVLLNLSRCVNPATNKPCLIMSGQDITARKHAEAERERLIRELRAAMAEIKTLKGLIPICAGCKKVRDDKGFWIQVESYIASRSEAQFTHGLCPECIKKYYPDLEMEAEQQNQPSDKISTESQPRAAGGSPPA